MNKGDQNIHRHGQAAFGSLFTVPLNEMSPVPTPESHAQFGLGARAEKVPLTDVPLTDAVRLDDFIFAFSD